MSNEPHIVAARRRAKMLSRQSGQSYQHHLNEVAREAGRPDWKAFLENPAPLPGDEPLPSPPGDDHARVDEITAFKVTDRRRWRRWFGRRTIIVATVLTLLSGLVAAAAWQQIVTSDIAGDMTVDRMAHGSADFIQRNVPVARNVRIGDMHRVDLVLVDSRAQMASWTYNVLRFFGYDTRLLFSGARTPEMRQTVKDSPILMVRMHANCRTRKWRMAAIVAATSYDGPPVRTEYYKRPPRIVWMEMSERNRHAVCDEPDSTRIPFQETPSEAQIAVQSIPTHDPRMRSDAGDANWYGIDLLHPVPIPGNTSSPPWHDVKAPDGWTSAAQVEGWSVPTDDVSGPRLELSLATRTPQAAVAATRSVADQLVRRFDLGPRSHLLTTASGYLVMKVRFSPIPRSDRPMSSTLRLVELRQDDDGVTLRVILRGRYTRDVQAWLASKKT
jgi:hypothetical protein